MAMSYRLVVAGAAGLLAGGAVLVPAAAAPTVAAGGPLSPEIVVLANQHPTLPATRPAPVYGPWWSGPSRRRCWPRWA